jgi:hypothetical protein
MTTWEHDPTLDRWTLHTFNDVSHLTARALDEPSGIAPDPVPASSGSDDRRYGLASARVAAERAELGRWVADFLSSPGSDNGALAHDLTVPPRWWLGPVEIPLDRLHRLAGPPGAPVLCAVDDDEWRDDVDDLAEQVGQDWEPPPVIASHRDGHLVLEDGNHRVEALRRAGRDAAWTVIGFDMADERSRFGSAPEMRVGGLADRRSG